ncbi:MAG: 30S ribosomal protein S20 [Deltaproteobacteria bacterium]|jgi:small subunit ribosomal protein S20|nr:30S ribosomal protein S20 [Deltaproteobacteria bacterium]MBW2535851.1 30S ribosomal protein S20 [Deltaproteobacteria bacterium]
MANHKSALKRHRQSLVRRARNRAVRSKLRSAIKTARTALAERTDSAGVLVKTATVLLDRAASKNVMSRKRVARIKSRLMGHLNAASKAPAAD